MLEKEKLAYFEKLLQSMRKELLRESLKKRLDEVDDESEVAKDPVDIASDERGKDLSLILSDRDQEKL
jgi:RNA polymerase-binding transcription factor DksA